MDGKPRRRGPRPSSGNPDKKSTISVRVSPALKDKLHIATEANDRSQSQEAEVRLERSFRDEEAVDLAQRAIYGRSLAGLLELLGKAMLETGAMAGFHEDMTLEAAKDWMSNPYAFEQVVQAVNTVLEAVRPDGPAQSRRKMGKAFGLDFDQAFANLGRGSAQSVLRSLWDPVSRDLAGWAESPRENLGDAIVKHIRKKLEG